MSDHKALTAIGCGIVLSLAILTFSNRVTTPNRNNPYFSYGVGDNRNGPIEVVDNTRVEIPVAFDIKQGIPEVQLAFVGEHSQQQGIMLSDTTVAVVDGKAASKIIIHFSTKPAFKAGTHILKVAAHDTSTGKIVSEGEIQILYNMHEVIGKCSC